MEGAYLEFQNIYLIRKYKNRYFKEKTITFFFNCYLAVPRPHLGHSEGDSLTNPMLITAFVQVRPEGHREPRNEVGSLKPSRAPGGFWTGNLPILIATP